MRPPAEREAPDPGDRSLARRIDNQNPRSHRHDRPLLCADADGGNVNDAKAAFALLERTGRMRYRLADKGYDADRVRRFYVTPEPFLSFPGDETTNVPSATTKTDTAADT